MLSDDALLNTTLKVLNDLIAFPTVALTPNIELIGYVENHLGPLCSDLVLTHDETRSRANLFATIGPNVDGGIVLSGHSDVVPVDAGDWATPPFEATRRGDRIYGRGTADMKGFIACALALAPEYAALDLEHPIHIALTFDEEDGFLGAPVLLKALVQSGRQPAACIIGEPTGLRVIGAHKGCYEYRTEITGLNGHSSEPDRAISAIHYATLWIAGLLSLSDKLIERSPDDSPYEPSHTTFNVGTIHGGQGRCVVAERCFFDWEMRPTQRTDAEFVKSHMEALGDQLLAEMYEIHPGATIETKTICEVDGLEWRESSPALKLMIDLLGQTPVDVVAYGTEAGLFQAAGIPAVVWGPGDISAAHRPNEFVDVTDLISCLQVLQRLPNHPLRST